MEKNKNKSEKINKNESISTGEVVLGLGTLAFAITIFKSWKYIKGPLAVYFIPIGALMSAAYIGLQIGKNSKKVKEYTKEDSNEKEI